MFRHTGQVAIVTGGTQGIGAAIVDVVLEGGAKVAILDVAKDALACARERFSGRSDVMIFDCDVRDEDRLRTVVREIGSSMGPADILFNNAGISAYFDPADMTSEQWDSVFAVDLKGLWLVSKHVIPDMKARRAGAIVNIASIHAHVTLPGMFPYAAAKAGVLGLTRSLALDLGPFGIRVNTLSPGYTRTALVQEWLAKQPDPVAAEEAVLAAHPMKRICEPAEIARVASFLASSEASAVTGTEFVVDAGLTARFAS